MNVGNILLRAGGAAVNAFLPGVGSEIVSLVNAFLPEDQKLPPDATGAQVQQAVSNLPPDKQAELLSKEMDVVLAEIGSWTQIQAALAAADGVGNSTRPKISERMANLVIAVTVIMAASAAWVCIKAGTLPSWELVTALLALPTVLLKAYFGLRTDEKMARYGTAIGQAPAATGISGWIQSFGKGK